MGFLGGGGELKMFLSTYMFYQAFSLSTTLGIGIVDI